MSSAPLRVAVVDHGMGNLRSVAKALEAAGGKAHVTSVPAEIRRADAMCVPGQGIFGRCVANLESRGLADLVRNWIADRRPFLGICLGMQVLFERSDERGPVEGLGVFAGEVRRLPPAVRVPHIGWNIVEEGGRGTHFYFDHAYAAFPAEQSVVRGWCEHGERFAAWIEDGALTAVQFHPEKSGRDGIELLKGWVGS